MPERGAEAEPEPGRIVRQIAARMSLRRPQRRSLEILARVLGVIDLSSPELPAQLGAIQALAGGDVRKVEDFERGFPSLCFALATGVGKTRLMGAFITYLYLGRHADAGSRPFSRNFFVLAPSTTIYDKLIRDFTPATEKYVFRGIAEFARRPPVIVTGENWDQGRGLRRNKELLDADVVVNIFNVDKINREIGRVRGPHDVIGEDGYYNYLAGLPDLVFLMDEAHRYRGKAAFRAIAGLRPMLGLELTATPKTVGNRQTAFRNVIYQYGLAEAMADGFVKQAAVLTRQNFDPDSVSGAVLERIKLDDGAQAHENTKRKLREYSETSGRPLVHPFMLVVAQDTQHAQAIRQIIESEDFFGGRYRGRVIRVDSALSGEENEEAINRLVALENDASTEIVIHVNKLKEGWDVRNLYTIVPLRASASDILTEQTLGRGLRLPYGERTGNEAVDTLTVIAHDHFDEVIRRAKAAGSIVLTPMEIGENGEIRAGGRIELSSSPIAEQMLTNELGEAAQAAYGVDGEQSAAIAAFVYHVIRGMESELTHIGQLRTPEVQARVTRQVEELIRPVQQTLPGFTTLDVAGIVRMLAAGIVDRMIEIPEIVLSPAGQVTFAFADFDLDGLDTIAPGPVDDGILVENLRTGDRQVIARDPWIVREARLEDHLVSRLLGYNEVDYRTNSDLLYKLAAQMVQHLRSCLASDADVENVLLNQGEDLAGFIFRQMMEHSRFGETPAEYRAHVARGFRLLQDVRFRVADMSEVRDFRIPVVPPGDTRRYVYTGFSRCLYEYQRFQSDEERRFAVLIDSDREPEVMRWMKPASGQFQIRYRRMKPYEPDFVVETVSERLIVEIKARKDLEDEEVLAKAAGARRWVGHANDHAMTYGGKSWRYALIPHDAVLGNSTLAGLIARFSQTAVPGAAPTV